MTDDMPIQSEAPWLAPDFLGEAPPLSYGYLRPGGWAECSLAELQDVVANDRRHSIPLVWTPMHARLVPPADVPELHDAVRSRAGLWGREGLRRSLINGVIVAAIFGRDITTGGHDAAFAVLIIAVIGVIPAAMAGWTILRSPGLSTDAVVAQGPLVRMSIWFSGRKPVLTKIAIGCILLVALSQLGMFLYFSEGGWDQSAVSLGVMKLDGDVLEWWRVFTAMLTHGGFIHLGFNLYALWILGRRVEVLAHWAYVPIVFLIAGISGSLIGLAMPRTVIFSVGSSGGVIGLIGFLLVLSFYHRSRLPKGMLKEVLSNIGLIALIGLVGFRVIDNAGHLGGLLGGMLVALCLLRTSDCQLPLRPGLLVKGFAMACIAAISLTAVFGAVMIWVYDAEPVIRRLIEISNRL